MHGTSGCLRPTLQFGYCLSHFITNSHLCDPYPAPLPPQVLSDVTEQYTPLRTLANGGKTDRKKKRRRRTRREPHCDVTLCVRQHGSAGLQLTDTSTARNQANAGHEPAGSGVGDMSAGDSSDGVTCSKRRWELSRHIKQLFIRGDNIVLITTLPSSSLPGQDNRS